MEQNPLALSRPDLVAKAIRDVIGRIVPTVSSLQLWDNGRDNQACAWLRQVSIYVAVRRFDLTQHAAADLWGRDRTTVRHAVRLVDEQISHAVTGALVDLVEQEARQALAALEAGEEHGVPLPASSIAPHRAGAFHG